MMTSKRRLRPLKPSTRAFIREARRTPGFSFFDWLHGYVYARWPYLYIGMGTGQHPLARFFRPLVGWLAPLFGIADDDPDIGAATFADGYHGKVMPLDAATRLVSVAEEVSLTDLERVIPYPRARDIVLRNPDHIAALECPCRAAREEPCLPLDVCLIVGEPFAGFIVEHHPRRARWVSQAEAAEILRAEHERGHVHHAFFKDAMLGRFYAICNCCACCCGAMQAWQNGTPMLASSGYVASADPARCTGCGLCVEFCQFEALSLDDGAVRVEAALCMGCGVCASKCKQAVLSLARAPDRGVPLEIRELVQSGGIQSGRKLGRD
jgi:ferredoxin